VHLTSTPCQCASSTNRLPQALRLINLRAGPALSRRKFMSPTAKRGGVSVSSALWGATRWAPGGVLPHPRGLAHPPISSVPYPATSRDRDLSEEKGQARPLDPLEPGAAHRGGECSETIGTQRGRGGGGRGARGCGRGCGHGRGGDGVARWRHAIPSPVLRFAFHDRRRRDAPQALLHQIPCRPPRDPVHCPERGGRRASAASLLTSRTLPQRFWTLPLPRFHLGHPSKERWLTSFPSREGCRAS
jgi:hypothetical protein